MLKIISLLIFVLLNLPAILVAQKISYVIYGKIGKLSSPAKAYLIYERDKVIREDSTAISSGRFTFRGVASHSNDVVYVVVSVSGIRRTSTGVTLIKLYTDSPSISIVSADSASKAKIIGGPLNRDAETLKAKLASIEAEILAAKKEHEEASIERKKLKNLDEAFEERIEALENKKKPVYLDFIKTYPNSRISLIALTKFAGAHPDGTEVEPVFNLLSQRVRSTAEGMAYAARIAVLKKSNIGSQAPDFTLYDTSGKPVSLHDFKGKYILLDFWASWCPPCRAESPNIAEIFKTYRDNDFTVLGVTLDNPNAKEAWLKAIREDQLTWTQVASDTMWYNLAAKLYSVEAIPMNFLIAPGGKIIAKNLRGEALKKNLKVIFAENTPASGMLSSPNR